MHRRGTPPFFARSGIPREILTDQGSNFTSQLLAELYRLFASSPSRQLRITPRRTDSSSASTRRSRLCCGGRSQKRARIGTSSSLTSSLRTGRCPKPQQGSHRSRLLYGRKVRRPSSGRRGKQPPRAVRILCPTYYPSMTRWLSYRR